ncbi:Mu transposase C-terminal domain-containing protein [Spirillospora sp. NPDC050679]
MSVSRPRQLRAQDQVRFGDGVYTVAGLTEQEVLLTDVTGVTRPVLRTTLFTDPGFSVVAAAAPLPPQGLLAGLPEEVTATAHWWEHHLSEVLAGLPAGADPTETPKPQYDIATTTLRQRELAKLAELKQEGHEIALSTLQRLRLAYATDGLWGLVDQRTAGRRQHRGDPRVLEAIVQAIREQTDLSTGTVGKLRRRVEQILAGQHGLTPDQAAEAMPSRATFYRLVDKATAGKHTFGSARTRRSLAQQPERPFRTLAAARPGQWMQIDSSPLNVAVRSEDGVVDRVELTWMIDLATRTIPAAVLRPSTKAVDAALLLARSLTPEPMRPGWSDAVRMARSVLPHRRLTEIDQRLADAAARPVIIPGTIVCDHGKVYTSQTFRNACRAMGINFQPTHKGSPWEKGSIETSFNAVDTLFAQYVAGYLGNSVEHRGKDAEQGAVWSMLELQELLDEWIVTVWQNRPHEGLRDPLSPGTALTPNEKYAALLETAGYVPVPLSQNDYIELLPVEWRAINSYGIKIHHRRYDCPALVPYRRQHSGIKNKKGLWEVHRDPYDVSRIWVRNHHDGGWIQATWTHLNTGPAPFGDLAWEHAQRMLARRGIDKPTEEQIAAAACALLDRAEQGPARTLHPSPDPIGAANMPERSKQDQKVAARTRATTAHHHLARESEPTPSSPAVPRPAAEPVEADANDDLADDQGLAKVIPLGVFDAAEEAKKRW